MILGNLPKTLRDPIPNAKGHFENRKAIAFELAENQKESVGVKDTSSEFLKYLDKQEIALGSEIEIIEKESFDSSLEYALELKK
jgi:DtxR family Mn-dependent transcriptional regulator